MIRIAVKGAYGDGNLGDDALLAASLGVVRRVCEPEETAIAPTGGGVASRLPPAFRRIDSSAGMTKRGDWLLYGGGTQFFSFPGSSRSATLGRRAVRLALSPGAAAGFLRRRLWPPERGFVRTAGLGLGLGPFTPGSWEEAHFREVVRRMDFFGARDAASADLAREWGAARVFEGADLALLPEPWTGAKFDPPDDPGAAGRVGFLPRLWPHDETGPACLAGMTRAAGILRKKGIEPVWFAFAPGDAPAVRAAAAASGGGEVQAWNPALGGMTEYIAEIGRTGVLATARYHGALFAARLGAWAIGAGLDPKIEALQRDLGAPDGIWRAPYSPEELAASAMAALRAAPEAKARLAEAVAILGRRAEAMAGAWVARVMELRAGAP